VRLSHPASADTEPNEQYQRATAFAITLARQIGVRGMSDAVTGAAVEQLCAAVAAAVWSRAPRWGETTRLEDDVAPPGSPRTTLLQMFEAAAALAAGAGFHVAPSQPDDSSRHAAPT
jgi:hypothetical protein